MCKPFSAWFSLKTGKRSGAFLLLHSCRKSFQPISGRSPKAYCQCIGEKQRISRKSQNGLAAVGCTTVPVGKEGNCDFSYQSPREHDGCGVCAALPRVIRRVSTYLSHLAECRPAAFGRCPYSREHNPVTPESSPKDRVAVAFRIGGASRGASARYRRYRF